MSIIYNNFACLRQAVGTGSETCRWTLLLKVAGECWCCFDDKKMKKIKKDFMTRPTLWAACGLAETHLIFVIVVVLASVGGLLLLLLVLLFLWIILVALALVRIFLIGITEVFERSIFLYELFFKVLSYVFDNGVFNLEMSMYISARGNLTKEREKRRSTTFFASQKFNNRSLFHQKCPFRICVSFNCL